jgi:uridine kinase
MLTFREMATGETLPLATVHAAVLEFLRGRVDAAVFGAHAVTVPDPERNAIRDRAIGCVPRITVNSELWRASDILRAVEALATHRTTRLVGIDGCGGAGKSTLAGRLAEARPDVTVVPMDRFFQVASSRSVPAGCSEIGRDFDWQRLREQVLSPLSAGIAARYQALDWDAERLAGWHEVESGGIVVVEGVYSIRSELSHFYDLRIWVECPADVRLHRGLLRDGESARARWVDAWMPVENAYAREHAPRADAHLVIDGNARDASAGSIVVLESRLGRAL